MNVDIFGRSYCRLCSLILYIYIFIFYISFLQIVPVFWVVHLFRILLCFDTRNSYQRHSQVWSAQKWPHKMSQLVFCPKDLWSDGNKTVNTWWKLFVSCRNHYGTMQEKNHGNTHFCLFETHQGIPSHFQSRCGFDYWYLILCSVEPSCRVVNVESSHRY